MLFFSMHSPQNNTLKMLGFWLRDRDSLPKTDNLLKLQNTQITKYSKKFFFGSVQHKIGYFEGCWKPVTTDFHSICFTYYGSQWLQVSDIFQNVHFCVPKTKQNKKLVKVCNQLRVKIEYIFIVRWTISLWTTLKKTEPNSWFVHICSGGSRPE